MVVSTLTRFGHSMVGIGCFVVGQLAQFKCFWVRRGVWAFALLRLAQFQCFVVHQNVRTVIDLTSAFPGSSKG